MKVRPDCRGVPSGQAGALLAGPRLAKPGCPRTIESIVLLPELARRWNVPAAGGARAAARGPARWAAGVSPVASRSCPTEAEPLRIHRRRGRRAGPAEITRGCAAGTRVKGRRACPPQSGTDFAACFFCLSVLFFFLKH